MLKIEKSTSVLDNIRALSRTIRISALKMVHHAKGSHLGGALSMADILAVLYGEVLRIDPKNFNSATRDVFILSKGHACSTLYGVLAEKGFFDKSLLDTYCMDGSPLPGHVTRSDLPGIDLSTGSLGHGLPVGCGMALAAKRDGSPRRVFVLIGDGECNEGSIWESVLFAQHHSLDNLTMIVDKNRIQSLGFTSDVLALEPLDSKFQAFNWGVRVVDGHNHKELLSVFDSLPFIKGRPSVVVANTVKGKGVSFMEEKLLWHYRTPNEEELKSAIAEVERKGV